MTYRRQFSAVTMIHGVTAVRLVSGPNVDIANSISIRIETEGGHQDMTLFDLPASRAQALADALTVANAEPAAAAEADPAMPPRGPCEGSA